MSSVSDVSAVSPSSTAIVVTDPQHVASVIQISLSREGKLLVRPDTVAAYYTHHGGGGDEMKPHRLMWMAMFPRKPGATILIRLTEINHPDTIRVNDPVVVGALRGKNSRWGRCTWVLEHDQNVVETEPIVFPNDRNGRIDFKYDVVLTTFSANELNSLLESGTDIWDKGVRVDHLDPGGHLIPDP